LFSAGPKSTFRSRRESNEKSFCFRSIRNKGNECKVVEAWRVLNFPRSAVGYQLEGRNASKNPISHSISRATRKRFNRLRPSGCRMTTSQEHLRRLPIPDDFYWSRKIFHCPPWIDWVILSAKWHKYRKPRDFGTGRFYFNGNERRWRLRSRTRNGNNAETTNNGEGKLRRELKRPLPFLTRYFWKRFIENVFSAKSFFTFSYSDHRIYHKYWINEKCFCLNIRDRNKNCQFFCVIVINYQKGFYFYPIY